MKIAIVGATGLVGSTLIKVLEERNITYTELILVASKRSLGKKIMVNGKEIEVITIPMALERKPDIAIFSAGGSTSKEWAPHFAKQGTTVIDNSSAWRMDKDIKLVVPEINAKELTKEDKIIANPNCSTIQMVVALRDIHKNYSIKRLVISTYQSVTGTGVVAVEQMENERSHIEGEMAYPHPIDKNCLPHGGDFEETGYTTEETKLVNETRKILGDPSIAITATVVRVPVVGGHSESINIETEKQFDLSEIVETIKNTEGVTLQNNNADNEYPMPIHSHDKDDVFVGRVRRDESIENGLNIWVVSDNLRKGAATNALQIAEYLMKNDIV